jgi:hypothetical protein
MKKLFFPAIVSSLVALTGCGAMIDLDSSASVDTSETSAVDWIHKIQPLGVNSSCFGSLAKTIRDHRFTPVRIYQEYYLQMKGDCSPPASSLVVKMLGGQQWVGGWSYVTISKNGLCLTNLTPFSGGYDAGESRWQACVAQNSSSPDRFRQQWLLNFNHNNALRIESHAAIRLGVPGGQVQCLDRVTPNVVKRGACSLHNFQIVRAQ